MRRAAFVVALATSWLMLLLWAAGVDWRAPPTPQAERSFPGSRFRGAFGRAEVAGQRLRVTAEGADHSALQVTQLPQLDARSFPILRYRFEDFPRTLELSLAFRTAENPDDVRTVPTITLNDLLDREGVKVIDLLSMDIEQHEPQALFRICRI